MNDHDVDATVETAAVHHDNRPLRCSTTDTSSHNEQFASSLRKSSSSLFHRPISGKYRTIATTRSNDNDKTKNSNNSYIISGG